MNLKINKDGSVKKPTVKATIVVHSMDEKEFEIMDISFHDEREQYLQEQLKNFSIGENSSPKIKQIYGELCQIDAINEMASIDLGDQGEVSEDIHKILWKESPEEMYHKVNVDLFYQTTRDWEGEVDTEVDFDYELVSSSKNYEVEESVFQSLEEYGLEESVFDEIDDI